MLGIWFRGTRSNKLYTQIKALEEERDALVDRNGKLTEENKQIKHDTKRAEEDIKHMVRMREEANALELDRKRLDCERERDTAVGEVKDKYRDKMEARLQKEVENIKEMYGEILQRLPKVTVRQHDINQGR